LILDVSAKNTPQNISKRPFLAKIINFETNKDFPGPKKWVFIAKYVFLVKKTMKDHEGLSLAKK
jgi:hypothetical protein